MGIASKCQRLCVQLVSPRTNIPFKLLVLVLLSLGALIYYVPTSDSESHLDIHTQHMRSQHFEEVLTTSNQKRDHGLFTNTDVKLGTWLSWQNDAAYRRSSKFTTPHYKQIYKDNTDRSSLVSTDLNLLSKLDGLDNSRPLKEGNNLKNSRRTSRVPPLSDGVLSPKTVRIMPVRPVLTQGYPLFITCSVKDVRSIISHDAPYLTFELPEMSRSLENEVVVSYRLGMAVLKIDRVRKGHEGTYKCVTVNQDGSIRYNIVEVRVLNEGHIDADNPVNGAPSRNHQHPKFLKQEDHMRFPTKDGELGGQSQTDIADLLERGKFQEQQVDQFCQRYNLTGMATQLPPVGNDDQDTLYRHLLLNDKTKTLFCFVPKVGCTNLRVLFFISQGLIPMSQLTASRDSVDQERLEEVQYAQSFLSRSNAQRAYTFKHYYRFMMYRNPLERLVSGYRSKVERFPLVGLDNDKPHYNWLRKAVYSETHPDEYNEFVRNKGKTGVNITFSNFIDYWLMQPEEIRVDEHFRSVFAVCQPCRTRFNFYGNFKHFHRDAQVLVEKIHSNSDSLRSGYYNNEQSTESLTARYYKPLTTDQKNKILKFLSPDLDFYYHLFPDEAGTHRTIMDFDT